MAEKHERGRSVETRERYQRGLALPSFIDSSKCDHRGNQIGVSAKAREHHPDKGGYSEMFDKVQKAFETLSCPKKREQYDRLQHVTQYRYIPGVTQRAVGGEDLLLDDIARLGLETDASTQLVVLCEVCGRPSTRVCVCARIIAIFANGSNTGKASLVCTGRVRRAIV